MDEDQSQTVYGGQKGQSVEPDEAPLEPTLTVEGYEPPPTEGDFVEPPPPPSGGFNFRIIIVASIALLILGGIGFFIWRFLQGGQSSGPVTITYWGLWEPEEVMKTVIDEYQRNNPTVTIEYKLQSPIEYRERLQAAIARGEGPDVFRFHNTWVPMLKNDLSAVPREIMSADEIKSTYYQVIQNDLIADNKFYGIPIGIDGLLMYYNKDLLAQHGQTVPVTWEEFETTALTLTRKDGFGSISQAGAAIGTADNVEHFSDLLGLILYQNGTDFSLLAGDKAVQALTYYTLFAQEPDKVWDTERDNSLIAFAGGTVGFIFAPSWQVFTLRALNPNLNFGVTTVPQLRGATPVSWATYWVEGVNVKSPHQKEAFDFLAFLSSKETLTKLFTESTKLRGFGEAYPRVDMAGELSSHEFLGPVLSQAPQMRSWYLASRTKDNGVNDKIISYFKDAVNAVYQGSSPQGAMETASKGVSQVLGEYGVQ